MSPQSTRAKRKDPEGKKANFLKRNRDWFIFFTSLLLLLSLVVKEQVRDKAKEKADTLANLRNMFYVRIDTLHVPDEIMANIDAMNLASPGSTIPHDQLETQLKKQLKVDFGASISSIHMVDTLSNLAKGLDLSEKDRTTLEDIKNRNVERGNAFKNISEALERHVVRAEDYDAAVRIAADASALDWEILNFGTALSDKADEEVAKLRKVYEWSAWISYLLALSLWYFAFLGKLYDVDLPEAVET